MSTRVIIASALLTALLAGTALFLVVGEGDSAIDPDDPLGRSETSGRTADPRTGRGSPGASPTDDGTGLVGSPAGDGRVWPRGSGGRTSFDPASGGSAADDPNRTGDPGGALSGSRTDGSAGGRDGSGVRRPGGRSGTTGSRGTGGRTIPGGPANPDDATSLVLGETVSVSGTIVALDPDGTQHESTSGVLEVRISGPGLDELREVAVVSGSWNAPAPTGANLSFVGATLDDRPATPSPAGPISVAAGPPIALVAEWARQTLLHVRARDTGELLCELEMIRVPDWLRNSRPHPGVVLATDARWTAECSPISLEAEGPHAGTNVPYHVRAPGYAWGRIALDTTSGGDREIQLDPGGTVDLFLIGGWQRPGAQLRLRVLGQTTPYAEVPVPGESLRIEGVLPGTYEVSVELGSWAQNPTILGSAEVTVTAGVVSPLELIVDDEEEEERVPFAGTVFVPTAWLLDEFQLRIRPIDPGSNLAAETQHIPSLEMTATPVPGGTLYGWQADDVQPGNFGLLVLPLGYGVNVPVGIEGNLDAAIALPDPIPVEVQTVLSGTEEPAYPALIRWTPARAPGVPGAGALTVMPEPGTNVFIFEAPIGDVILSCSDEAYRPASRSVTLTPEGPNVFTFELEAAHGLNLHLFDEETPVPWDIGWHAQLAPAEGTEGSVVVRGRIGLSYRVLVSSPGTYTLTLPDIDGFLPVPPQLVEVYENQILDLDIPLVREP